MVFHREQRFSIRKFSVGAASVLIGITMAGQVVSAEEIQTTQPNVVAPADSTEPKATEEVATSSPTQDKSTAEETSGANPVNNSEATPSTSAPAESNSEAPKQDKKSETDATGESEKGNDPKEKASLPTDVPKGQESDRVDEKLAMRKMISVDAGRK